MALFQDPKTGKTYEEREGQFYEVDPQTAGARLASQEMGAGEAALAAMGGMFQGLGRGARMRGAQITGDPQAFERARAEQAAQAPYLGGIAAEHPMANVVGQVAPWLAIPAGAGIAAGTGIGAAAGFLSPRSDVTEDVLMGAGFGGAAAGAGAALRGGRGFREIMGFEPGERAARVRAGIEGQGQAAAAAIPGPGGAVRAVSTLDDLVAEGRGSLAAQAAGMPEDAAARAAASVDPSLAMAGGRALTGGRNAVHDAFVRDLDDLGFELTIGQRANNINLRQAEASLASSPWSSAPFQAIQSKNQFLLNRLYNQAIGQADQGDIVSLERINRAYDSVTEAFQSAGKVVDKVGGVPRAAIDSRVSPIVERWKNLGIDLPGLKAFAGNLRPDGKTYSAQGLTDLRQVLGGLAGDAKAQGMSQRVAAYREMQEAIDNGISQVAGEETANALRAARERFRLLILTERPGILQGEQNIARGPMQRALQMGFRGELRGKREASAESARLIRAVRALNVVREVVGDSGTATRMSMQMLMNAPIRAIAQAGISRAAAEAYLLAGRRWPGMAEGAAKMAARGEWERAGERMSGMWGSPWGG